MRGQSNRLKLFTSAILELLVLTPLLHAVDSGPLGHAVESDSLVYNIEFDYMADASHSHAPTQETLDLLRDIFACEGITLNLYLDDVIPHRANLPYDSMAAYRQTYFDHSGVVGWAWGLCADNDDAQTCVCYGGGMYLSGDPAPRPSCIMHELGHRLGIGWVESFPVRPNWPSVMNYRYKDADIAAVMVCSGLATTCPPFKMLDYSHGTLDTLNEFSLNEQVGIGFGPVDWNCNGVIDSVPVVAKSREFPCGSSSVPGPMWAAVVDIDDWSVVKANIRGSRRAVPLDSQRVTAEDPVNDLDQIERMIPLRNACMTFYGKYAGQNCTGILGKDIDGDSLLDFCDPCPYQASGQCCCRYPGDATRDGNTDWRDPEAVYNYIFRGGSLTCLDAADANGDSRVNISDVVCLYLFIYSGGARPVCGTRGY